jgi:hypothetical protein
MLIDHTDAMWRFEEIQSRLAHVNAHPRRVRLPLLAALWPRHAAATEQCSARCAEQFERMVLWPRRSAATERR